MAYLDAFLKNIRLIASLICLTALHAFLPFHKAESTPVFSGSVSKRARMCFLSRTRDDMEEHQGGSCLVTGI